MATRSAVPRRAIGAPTKAMTTMVKLLRHRRSSALLVTLASASAATPTPSSPASRPHYRVAVVGGGVIGLSTALRLAEGETGGGGEQLELSIAVLARGFGAETTSSGAGGLWEPYKLGDTPAELVNRWSAETLAYLLALARGGEGGEEGGAAEEDGKGGAASSSAGVLEGPVFQYWTKPVLEDPSWAAVAPGFRRLSAEELREAHQVTERGAEANRRRRMATEDERQKLPSFVLEAPAIVDGWTFSSAAAQPSRYLSWLEGKAERAGVELVRRELGSLDELLLTPIGEEEEARFDAVVNCAGLAGGELSRDDSSPPTPVRGQVARLRPPRISSPDDEKEKNSSTLPLGGAAGLFLDEETYLIRNVDFVVAGGTGQTGDADDSPRPEDRESILARVRLLSPELLEERVDDKNNEQQIEDWAGLRPLRSPVRLEARRVEVEVEEREGEEKSSEQTKSRPRARSNVLVVSNYGHGGSGFTLHWGCAGDAAALVLEGLRERQ